MNRAEEALNRTSRAAERGAAAGRDRRDHAARLWPGSLAEDTARR